MEFWIYKPTPPLGAEISSCLEGLPWIYDQDKSSGYSARMLVVPKEEAEKIKNTIIEKCAEVAMSLCSVIEEPHEFERCRDAILALKGT